MTCTGKPAGWFQGRKMVAQAEAGGRRESFAGRMRDELLNETLFVGLDHARQVRHLRPMPLISPQQAPGCAILTSSAAHLLLTPRRKAHQLPRL
jgi:hypothetical protein